MLKHHRSTAGIVLLIIIAVAAGWLLGRVIAPAKTGSSSAATPSLRESGYDLTDPLLVCAQDSRDALDTGAQKVIQNTVDAEIQNHNINVASVYYRQFLGGGWALLNGEEKYYPASLNKIPLMMAYYYEFEESGIPFTRTMTIPAGFHENEQQEIQPEHPLQQGNTYTVQELIDAMIKDSDNNATLVLLDNIDQATVQTVYADLNVPYLAPGQTPSNYMSVSDYAFFFRVLYNGTFLSHADSEKALDILSDSTFNAGLVAGVPSGTIVAHKFGLVSVAPGNTVVVGRELHDCGIIYPSSKNPYLLCVMTKSTGTLAGAEKAIADVSRAVYQYVDK